jgi:hypothetical protein
VSFDEKRLVIACWEKRGINLTEELENDPDNPCFGCGPKNPKGMKLLFFKNDDMSIFADVVFDTDYSSWPGQVYGGIVFGALECTCQWTFYNFKGQVGPTERFQIEFLSRVLTNEKSRLVGRIVKEDSDIVSVKAEIFQEEQLRAFMNQEMRIVRSREEFRKLRPAVKFDSVMEKNLPIK